MRSQIAMKAAGLMRGPTLRVAASHQIIGGDGIAREKLGLLQSKHHRQAHAAARRRSKNKNAAVGSPVYLILAVVFLERFHNRQPAGLKIRGANSPERRGGSWDLCLRAKIHTACLACHEFPLRCFIDHYPGYARFRVAFQLNFDGIVPPGPDRFVFGLRRRTPV